MYVTTMLSAGQAVIATSRASRRKAGPQRQTVVHRFRRKISVSFSGRLTILHLSSHDELLSDSPLAMIRNHMTHIWHSSSRTRFLVNATHSYTAYLDIHKPSVKVGAHVRVRAADNYKPSSFSPTFVVWLDSYLQSAHHV